MAKPVKVMKEGWPGPPDGYTAYGLDWANASNTPFREYKHWVHEGGYINAFDCSLA